MYLVLRRFSTDGRELKVGELVVGNFRLLNELITQRFLSKYDGTEMYDCGCGVKFTTQLDLDRHASTHTSTRKPK
jgi:hypothetical protein